VSDGFEAVTKILAACFIRDDTFGCVRELSLVRRFKCAKHVRLVFTLSLIKAVAECLWT
jgi:hypothetical protein